MEASRIKCLGEEVERTCPGDSIAIARSILTEAFDRDKEPGSFYHGYIANIACVLQDNFSDLGEESLPSGKANDLAEAVMQRLFF